MTNQIQKGGFQAFREELPRAVYIDWLETGQCHHQFKTVEGRKKAPEGAFESALYPGLKDST